MRVLYILSCDRRGVLSTHKTFSSAVVALWIEQTVESDCEDRSRIFEFKAGSTRRVEADEYLLALRPVKAEGETKSQFDYRP